MKLGAFVGSGFTVVYFVHYGRSPLLVSAPLYLPSTTLYMVVYYAVNKVTTVGAVL